MSERLRKLDSRIGIAEGDNSADALRQATAGFLWVISLRAGWCRG